MLKKFLIVSGAVLLAGVLASSGCHRWKHHGTMQERSEWFQKRISSELKLDADQKTKLSEIMKRFSDRFPDMKEKRMKVVDLVAKEFEAEKFNAAALNGELDTMQKEYVEMKSMMVQALSDFHAILNAEQKKKFADHMRKFQKHHH